MDQEFANRRRLKLDEWIAERHPPGVWIDLGAKDRPDKVPHIPGTRYDKQGDTWIFRACDGSEVLGLTRPHRLVDDVE